MFDLSNILHGTYFASFFLLPNPHLLCSDTFPRKDDHGVFFLQDLWCSSDVEPIPEAIRRTSSGYTLRIYYDLFISFSCTLSSELNKHSFVYPFFVARCEKLWLVFVTLDGHLMASTRLYIRRDKHTRSSETGEVEFEAIKKALMLGQSFIQTQAGVLIFHRS